MRALRKKDGYFFQLFGFVYDEDGNEFSWNDIDLAPEEGEETEWLGPEIEIDWERRRYEIAKAIFPFASQLTTDTFRSGRKVEGSAGKTVMQVCAETTLYYADALIEELKKQKCDGGRD